MQITIVVNNKIGYSFCFGHGDLKKCGFSQMALFSIQKEYYEYTDGKCIVAWANSIFDFYCFRERIKSKII